MGSGLLSKLGRRLVNLKATAEVDEAVGRAGIAGGGTLRASLDAIWPPRCVLCGGEAAPLVLTEPDNLCAGCRLDLPRFEHGCRRCGNPLPRDIHRCGECLKAEPRYDRTLAALIYRPPVDRLIQRFKFHRDLAAGLALAGALAGAAGRIERPQLLVPVPLHWARASRRGFNQAELLARDTAAAFEGPPVHSLLKRIRSTATQSSLIAGRRRSNVRGAFECRSLPPGLRHVALVDDVMTTGATLDECAATLKRAGVERVDAWVAARA